MSWYNTVVLSFSHGEFDGSAPPKTFGPLLAINSWLNQQQYDSLSNLNRGKLATNAILFGGCYNRLDVEGFMQIVWEQNWAYRDCQCRSKNVPNCAPKVYQLSQ